MKRKSDLNANLENALNPLRLFGLVNSCPKCGYKKAKETGRTFWGTAGTVQHQCNKCKFKY